MDSYSDSPVVSVIIPVYNTAAWLEDCIDSVVTQSLREIEIICVDDGSTDGSSEILRRWEREDPRIRVISQENGGLSYARNRGMERAVGRYVYFLDSDDRLVPGALEALVRISEEKELDVLLFSGTVDYESEELRKSKAGMDAYCRRTELVSEPVDGLELLRLALEHMPFCVIACTFFFNRRFLSEGGVTFREGIIHEDELFSVLILSRAKRVCCVAEAYYCYRVREGSLTTGDNLAKRFVGSVTVAAELLDAVRNDDPPLVFSLFRKRADEMLFAAAELYREIPPPERDAVRCSLPARYFGIFQIYLEHRELGHREGRGLRVEESDTAEDELERLKAALEAERAEADRERRERCRYQEEVCAIRASWTYRIGRAMTWIPRKIRTAAAHSGIRSRGGADGL